MKRLSSVKSFKYLNSIINSMPDCLICQSAQTMVFFDVWVCLNCFTTVREENFVNTDKKYLKVSE